MEKEQRYGATQDDWTHFDLILGLTQDLLPVVSNPKAVISEKSTIKALGKTPSLYNKESKAVGITNWTEKLSTAVDVDKWSKNKDYGICIQTRRVRALDIDVTDKQQVKHIEQLIFNKLGILPKRYRKNSPKILLAFIVEGDFYKRVLPVQDGMIEFLAQGQQFIASGTHESSARYDWIGGLPIELPTVSPDAFESLWNELVETFATGEVSTGIARRSKQPLAVETTDDILPYLEVLSYGKEGEAFIQCPFKDQHTTGSSETATAYFPRGGRGYGNGHFKCFHAHCSARSDDDFIEALNIVAKGFDIVNLSEEEKKQNLITKPLDRELSTNENGKILATVENLYSILMRPDLCGCHIKFDEFKDEILFSPVNEINGWRPLKDTDYTQIRVELAKTGFNPIGREIIRDVIHLVAHENRFDSAIEWLNGLQWDGVQRVDTFLEKYLSADDNAYNRAVSAYMWTALAGRVMSPGCKADAAPVFVGKQYIGKSFAISSLVPDPQFFTEIRLDDNEDNLSRKMRGKLVAEFAELRGLHSKEMEGIKAFISRQYENWIPKYQEFATTFPRRLLFIGTTNKDEFFADDTGNRRWLPVRVEKADEKGIKKDREMLWVEGREMFLKNGIKYYYDMANNLGEETRKEFMLVDIWEDKIKDWLYREEIDGTVPANCEFLQVSKIMQEALMIEPRNMKTFDAMRVGKILRKLGFEKINKRVNGILTKVWVKDAPVMLVKKEIVASD